MSKWSFEFDNLAFLIAVTFAVLLAFVFKWSHSFLFPTLFFSNLRDFAKVTGGWRRRFVDLPEQLQYASLLLFFIAFIDPHFFFPKTGHDQRNPSQENVLPTKGIAIYLVLDQSGSMKEKINAISKEGRSVNISKIDLLKQLTKEFVEDHPNDLIGLVTLARTTQIASPLTLDHQRILQQLSSFDAVKSPDQDGTAIGYAIYKTANLIDATRHYAQDLVGSDKPAYEIKNTIMILVTDGFQDPNPLDKGSRLRNIEIEEAARFAKEKGIRLYIINVEPSMALEEFAPHRHQMQRASELTGGSFYLVDSTTGLSDIYQQIGNIEKGILPNQIDTKLKPLSKDQQPDLYQRLSLYPYFIGLGMISLFASILLSATWLRKVP